MQNGPPRGNVYPHHPDYELPFVIQTDASSVGLGAILLQVTNEQEKTNLVCIPGTLLCRK